MTFNTLDAYINMSIKCSNSFWFCFVLFWFRSAWSKFLLHDYQNVQNLNEVVVWKQWRMSDWHILLEEINASEEEEQLKLEGLERHCYCQLLLRRVPTPSCVWCRNGKRVTLNTPIEYKCFLSCSLFYFHTSCSQFRAYKISAVLR